MSEATSTLAKNLNQCRQLQAEAEQARAVAESIQQKASLAFDEYVKVLCPFKHGDIINIPAGQHKTATRGRVQCIGFTDQLLDYELLITAVNKKGQNLKCSFELGSKEIEAVNKEFLARKGSKELVQK